MSIWFPLRRVNISSSKDMKRFLDTLFQKIHSKNYELQVII